MAVTFPSAAVREVTAFPEPVVVTVTAGLALRTPDAVTVKFSPTIIPPSALDVAAGSE